MLILLLYHLEAYIQIIWINQKKIQRMNLIHIKKNHLMWKIDSFLKKFIFIYFVHLKMLLACLLLQNIIVKKVVLNQKYRNPFDFGKFKDLYSDLK